MLVTSCSRVARRRARRPSATTAVGLIALLAMASGAAGEPVSVFFPRGNCASGRLEIEIWEPGSEGSRGRWLPHPTLPQVDAETCQRMESRILLNEMRVRCIDPAGVRMPSSWVVGADITGRVASSCPPS